MNNVYLGSDWHFSKWKEKEQILKYNNKKNRDIIRKYNSIVTNSDIFIFLGDLTEVIDDNPKEVKKCIDEIKNIKGKKIFIRGNNDIMPDEYYINELGFINCIDELRIRNFIFTHKPIELEEGEINIHGHLHAATTYWDCSSKNHVDAYTRSFKNYPISLGALLYKGKFLEEELINGDVIQQLKSDLFDYIELYIK